MIKIFYVIVVIIGIILIIFNDKIYAVIKKNPKVIENYNKLYVKDNVQKEVKKFYFEKIKIVGFICILCGCMGLISCPWGKNENRIINISRPLYSEGNGEYNFNIVHNDTQENITLNIAPKRYKRKEAKEICDEAFDKWKRIFCGKNKSLDDICNKVVLSDSISGYDVNFEYYVDEKSYIDYEGNILFDKVAYKNGKCKGVLHVMCSVGEYQFDYSLSYIIKENKKTIENLIQEEINSQDKYSEIVELPSKINSENIIYYNDRNKDNSVIFLLISVISVVVIYIGKDRELSNEIKKRDEQLRYDYSEMISMLSLLQQTGQSIRNSWNKIIDNYKNSKNNRYIYSEMKLVKSRIENGVSERQAYREFGKRCGTPEYIRLANIIDQNLSKGSNSISHQLERERYEAAKTKIAFAKRKAEECSTKMLIPLIMMLIIVMAILLIPAFINMNM